MAGFANQVCNCDLSLDLHAQGVVSSLSDNHRRMVPRSFLLYRILMRLEHRLREGRVLLCT